MAITSTKRGRSGTEFPKLMAHIAYEYIVLFEGPTSGMIVHTEDKDFPVGKMFHELEEEEFVNYQGEICLHN